MGLFTPDLFRSLGLGFLAGALGFAAVMGGSAFVSDSVAPPALAAQAER